MEVTKYNRVEVTKYGYKLYVCNIPYTLPLFEEHNGARAKVIPEPSYS